MESNKHRGMSDREASPPPRLALIPATSFGRSLVGRDNQAESGKRGYCSAELEKPRTNELCVCVTSDLPL